MPLTAAPAGISLTTALQTVITNPAGSKENRTYEIRFLNIDGVNSADLTQCLLLDASASNATRPVMAVNARVAARDALATRITLEPGDSVQASASAAGDIYALPQQVFAEVVP